MVNSKVLVTVFQIFFLIFLIIMLLSVLFMFVFCLIPLKLESLRAFNGFTIAFSFCFGGFKAYKKTDFLGQGRVFLISVLSPALIIFGVMLFMLTLAWGYISIEFWLEKVTFALLGSVLGIIFGKNICNFH